MDQTLNIFCYFSTEQKIKLYYKLIKINVESSFKLHSLIIHAKMFVLKQSSHFLLKPIEIEEQTILNIVTSIAKQKKI